MISTNFITGTGFIKCIPITFSGREVWEAMRVIEIEEVLVARMAWEGAILSSLLKISNLRSGFSVAAYRCQKHINYFSNKHLDNKISVRKSGEISSRRKTITSRTCITYRDSTPRYITSQESRYR